MSATGRQRSDGSQIVRVEQDAYQTPRWCVDALLRHIRVPQRPLTFLEPCRGEGVIYNAVIEHWRARSPSIAWLAPRWCEITRRRDYLTPRAKPADLCITNPPYGHALDFLEKSLAECQTVCYLLRLNYLGSGTRADFWEIRDHQPTHTLVLAPRPRFVDVCKGDKRIGLKACGASYRPGSTRICTQCGGKVGPGSDATEYAWFCWDRAGLLKLPRWLHVLRKAPEVAA